MTIKQNIKDVLDWSLAFLVILPAFWLIIQYGAVHELVKEMYYRAFRIPYYKGNDKFHHYVRRTDK